MRRTILTVVLSALVLVSTPAATRAGIVITFSDPSSSTAIMAIQMDSVDISTITSATDLQTVLNTASDYTKVTTFFPTGPTPIIYTGPFRLFNIPNNETLPVTTFDQPTESFTSVLPDGVQFNFVGSGLTSLSTGNGSILLESTNGAIFNALSVNGSTLDGTIASVPEGSTLCMGAIGLATCLACARVRRWWRGRG